MDKQLLPCPFCERKAECESHENNYGENKFHVFCLNWKCVASSKDYNSFDEAIKAWNTRPPQNSEAKETVITFHRNQMYERFTQGQRAHECPGFDCSICSNCFENIFDVPFIATPQPNDSELSEEKIMRIMRGNIKKVNYLKNAMPMVKIRGYEKASQAICKAFKEGRLK